MRNVWQRIEETIERHDRAALVSVVDVVGSAPRDPGARMIVQPKGGFFGTIGGGRLEYEVLAIAQAALASDTIGASTRVWALGPTLGQCCGGSVTTLIETFDASDLEGIRRLTSAEESGPFATISRMTEQGRIAREILAGPIPAAANGGAKKGSLKQPIVERFGEAHKTVLLFGAGHIGRALVLALAPLPFSVRWIDNRADQFPQYAPTNAVVIRTDTPELEIEVAPAGAFAVVVTHSHQLDYAIAAAALGRKDLGFIGLIGSTTKRARFNGYARKLGIPEKQIARLACPIGLPDIKGKGPAVIAAGVVAQMLIERDRFAVSADGR